MTGQGHIAAAHGGMSLVAQLLLCQASSRIIPGEEERLRALRHVCAALPRTAQALLKQVRQPSPVLWIGVPMAAMRMRFRAANMAKWLYRAGASVGM